LVRLGWPRGLNGQELEAELVAPVFSEQARSLDSDLDVIPDLSFPGKPGKARRERPLDVGVHQLLGAVHDANTAQAKQSGARSNAAGSSEAADAGHCCGVTAGVVEGDAELEGKAVLARSKNDGCGQHGFVLVRKDLCDLVHNFVVLSQDVAAGAELPLRDASPRAVGRHAEGSLGLALELDDDGADVLIATERNNHVSAHNVEVGVELGLVLERNAD